MKDNEQLETYRGFSIITFIADDGKRLVQAERIVDGKVYGVECVLPNTPDGVAADIDVARFYGVMLHESIDLTVEHHQWA